MEEIDSKFDFIFKKEMEIAAERALEKCMECDPNKQQQLRIQWLHRVFKDPLVTENTLMNSDGKVIFKLKMK